MAKLSLATFDQPLVFVFAVTLAVVPVIALAAALMARAGLPSPIALAGGNAA